VNIDIPALLVQNHVMLIFFVLMIGLLIAKIKIGPIEIGGTIGVLITAIVIGGFGYTTSTEALAVGFMLFIFCVGIEAGPNFFGIFMRDGLNCLVLVCVILISSILITLIFNEMFSFEKGLAAGMMAGSLTATPVFVGAKDALSSNASTGDELALLGKVIDQLSVGYALAYLMGLISLIVIAGLLPKLLPADLAVSAKELEQERGIGSANKRKVYLPIIRAYFVSEKLLNWAEKNRFNTFGMHSLTGCHIVRLRRNSRMAVPTTAYSLQEGDEIAIVGSSQRHAQLDPSFRSSQEIFHQDLLDLRIVEEDVVLNNPQFIDKKLSNLDLDKYGCFMHSVVRAQIEIPPDGDMLLHKGDMLRVTGERDRISSFSKQVGFVYIHSQTSDLLAFSAFFVFGLLFGMTTMSFGGFTFGLGNSVALLSAGIALGYLRANHPTFGYVPQGALNMLKNLGLLLFMVGIGLSAGDNLFTHFSEYGIQIIIASIFVSIIPVVLAYFVGSRILKMNPALLVGAIVGARTCAPAMDMIDKYAKSTIPELGYAGSYVIANILMTFAGTIIILLT